jgi:hypothetical protein
MTDPDLSNGIDLNGTMAPAQHDKMATDRVLAHVAPKRQPPNRIEKLQIEKAKTRTKRRFPRIALHIEDRPTGARAVYAHHSDDEGQEYRLADAFGTQSRHFVHAMLNSLGQATEDHSQTLGITSGTANEDTFNSALAVIDGVRPQDEIEAMLAAHMAVTNLALLELVARTRDGIAGHSYQGDGIKRLDVLGNLTNRFMRTFCLQVEALARKRRKGGEQNVTVKHVHIHSGAQAVVGIVNHRRRGGYEEWRASLWSRTRSPCNSRTPFDAERGPGAASPAGAQRPRRGGVDCTAARAVAAGLLASAMANTLAASGPRELLRSGGDSAHC